MKGNCIASKVRVHRTTLSFAGINISKLRLGRGSCIETSSRSTSYRKNALCWREIVRELSRRC